MASSKRSLLKRARGALPRTLKARLSPIDPPERLHEFWRQPAPPGNDPEDYLKPGQRSRALERLLEGTPTGARILEIGCNVGRNLAHLADQGYTNLEGVEINPHAVALLRKSYPQLAETPVHIGPAEEVLPTLEAPLDVIYTMAVLTHIHPDGSVVFDEMARLAKQLVLVEVNHLAASYIYPHDFEAIFTRHGFKLEADEPMKEMFPFLAGDSLWHYRLWRFSKEI